MALKPRTDRVQERLLALLACHRTDPEIILSRLREFRDLDRVPAFAIAMRHLVRLEIPETEAESVLREILLHRRDIERGLRRDPGLTVAALDLLTRPGSRFARQLSFAAISGGAPPPTEPLTGLRTRDFLLSALQGELRRCLRSRQPLCVVLVEIEPPASLGEAPLDRAAQIVLQRVATAFRRSIRDTDPAGLLGRYRFAVLAPATGLSGALVIGRRIRANVLQSLAESALPDRDFVVSVGVSSAPAGGRTPAQLLGRAEEALAVGRESGAGLFAHPSERRAAVRSDVRSTVRGAIARPGLAGNHVARPIDLSRRGALFVTDACFRVWEAVSIRLALDWDVPRELHGRVVRIASGPERRFEVAVRFDPPLPEDAWLSHALRGSPGSVRSEA